MALSTPLVLLRWNSDIPRETPLERRAITDRREAIREYLAEASISSGGSANERRLKREGNRMWTSLSSRSTRSPRFEGALVDVPANCSRRRRTGMSKTYQSDSKGGVSSLRRLPERPCTYPGSGERARRLERDEHSRSRTSCAATNANSSSLLANSYVASSSHAIALAETVLTGLGSIGSPLSESWRRSQVVRQGPAKPLFTGSNPVAAFLLT